MNPDLEKYRILIVEDDKILRDAMVREFKKKGLTVFNAENGTVGFEIVKSQNIDFVISDIRMPNGDGLQMLDSIRGHNPTIPVVIFVTGFADVTEDECIAKGAKRVFAKPFDRKTLVNYVIETLVGSQIIAV